VYFIRTKNFSEKPAWWFFCPVAFCPYTRFSRCHDGAASVAILTSPVPRRRVSFGPSLPARSVQPGASVLQWHRIVSTSAWIWRMVEPIRSRPFNWAACRVTAASIWSRLWLWRHVTSTTAQSYCQCSESVFVSTKLIQAVRTWIGERHQHTPSPYVTSYPG